MILVWGSLVHDALFEGVTDTRSPLSCNGGACMYRTWIYTCTGDDLVTDTDCLWPIASLGAREKELTLTCRLAEVLTLCPRGEGLPAFVCLG